MVVETVNDPKQSWLITFAWVVVSVALVVSVLGAMTIGLYVLPFALAGFLVLNKWGRKRKNNVPSIDGDDMMQRRSRMIRFAAGLFFFVIIVILVRIGSPTNPMTTESGRVQNAFNGIYSSVLKKEAVPLSWLTPVRAGTVSYADGSKASLWVPKSSPQGNRSNCFYVDEPSKGGASGFYEFSCLVPKSPMTLERQGSIVVGFVSMTRATQASVSVLDLTFKVPITYGYFLVPGVLSLDPNAKFTVTFSDPTGSACKVTNVLAPGSTTSEECVIPSHA